MADPAKKPVRRTAKAARKEDPPVARPVLAASPVRGRLAVLSPVQAEALRVFFNTQQSWTLPDNGVLQCMPGKPGAAADTFQIDAEGVRIGLCLHVLQASDGLHWSDYQGRSRVLAWSLAHERQLMRLSDALGVALTPIVDPASSQAGELADPVWLDFIIDDDPGESPPPTHAPTTHVPTIQGTLQIPASWLERLLVRADPPYDDAPTPLGRWRELPAGISLQLPLAPLPASDWAGLRAGDVIVVGRRSRLPPIEARACGRAWPVSPANDGWRVEGPSRHIPIVVQENPKMIENEAPIDESGGEQAPVDADALTRQLPVDVAFEIGRTELSMGDLSSLQPGYVFPLPVQLEGANVTIRANGRAVGQGEVVAVGDTLGVRLLWWN